METSQEFSAQMETGQEFPAQMETGQEFPVPNNSNTSPNFW